MRATSYWSVLIPPLLFSLAGCGRYTFAFQLADVINTGGLGSTAREMLDVDILCLHPDNVEKHPEIINGTMTSKEWFEARDKGDPNIGDIAPGQIYALRKGTSADKRDTLLGEPLLSFVDSRKRQVEVSIRHLRALVGGSAIAIYGRFHGEKGIARTPPVVLKPPPPWLKRPLIQVGETTMSCTNYP